MVDLLRHSGHGIGFSGNSAMQVWESGDYAAIRREVLRKLNAAKGGGGIFQSDHSVSSAVSGQTYDYYNGKQVLIGLIRWPSRTRSPG